MQYTDTSLFLHLLCKPGKKNRQTRISPITAIRRYVGYSCRLQWQGFGFPGIFTARCYAQHGIANASCLSVSLRYRDHIRWNSLKIISRLISLNFPLGRPQHHGSNTKGTPQILAGIGVG